jgi:integrase
MRPGGLLLPMKFGRVVPRHGQGRNGKTRTGWVIDLGRYVTPRYLTSARGARFETRETAEAILAAIRVKIARGTDPQAAVDEFAPTTSERNSLRHWLGEYLAHCEERCSRGQLSPNHVSKLRACAADGGYWSWWGERSLPEVDPIAVDRFARALYARGLGPKSVRNILGYFRAALVWLARMGRIPAVPVFPSVRVPDHRPTIISPRTQDLILAEIPRELRGAYLAGCHGVRPGEIRALDLRDVEARDDVPGLVVSRAVKGRGSGATIGPTKTRDASWIPITDELDEWIQWRRRQREDAWSSRALFVNPQARGSANPEFRWSQGKLSKVWNRACEVVGVRVSLYEGTKHSSATAWRTRGMSLEHVRRMLRHRDAKSTELYGKLADGALVEAFRRGKR